MTKMFKKAISLLVVCALAFTTLATGVFAAAVPTISLDAVATDLTIGDEAVVTVTSANSIGDWGAYQAKVTIPDGLTVKTVMYKLDDYEAVELEALNSVDYVPGDPWYNVKNNVISFVDVIATASTVVYTITFDAIEAAGTYAVVAALATADAEILEESEQTVNFVVSEEVVEPSQFTVTFVDDAGNTLKTETVDAGAAATAPELEFRAGYLASWDKEFAAITEDTTVTAVYTAAVDTELGLSANVILGDTFGLNFLYRHDRAGVTSIDELDDIYVTFSKQVFDGDTEVEPAESVMTMDQISNPAFVNTSGQTCFSFEYYGIAAKELTNDVTARFYYVKDGVLYCSKVGTTSIANLAVSQMNTYKASDTKLVTVFMDMLNYGTAAQKYFGYRESLYANEYVRSNGTAATSFADFASEAAQPYEKDVVTTGEHLNGAGLSIKLSVGSAVGMTVSLRTGTNVSDDFYLKYSYTTVTGLEKGDTIYMADWNQNNATAANYTHNYIIESLAAKDLRQTITFAIYDAEGNQITKTATTSIVGYLAGQVTDDSMTELCNTIVMYSDSAKAYFS